MINAPKEALGFIKRTLKEHFPDCEFRVFGSRINGKIKPYSDIDIAVVGKKKLDFTVLSDLKYAFQESELSFRVDVMDWNDLSESFKKIILEKYEVL